MKFRKSFVTNSSSSSYIIAFDENTFDEETLNKYPCLKIYGQILRIILQGDNEHCTSSCLEETEPGYLIRNERELYRFIEENSSYELKHGELGEQYLARLEDGDWDKKRYMKILKLVQEGKTVVVRTVSYHDSLNELFELLADNGIIKIIECEEE